MLFISYILLEVSQKVNINICTYQCQRFYNFHFLTKINCLYFRTYQRKITLEHVCTHITSKVLNGLKFQEVCIAQSTICVSCHFHHPQNYHQQPQISHICQPCVNNTQSVQGNFVLFWRQYRKKCLVLPLVLIFLNRRKCLISTKVKTQ